MLVLISSGAQRRYADDIVRALAHPTGTEFQFRYDEKYVDPKLLHRLNASRLTAEPALISFLSVDDQARTTKLVPVRFVAVTRTQVVGSSRIFTLKAGSFVDALDDTVLRSRLTQSEQFLIPAFTGQDPRPSGKFVLDVAVDLHADAKIAANATRAMAAFEKTATALSEDAHFGATSRLAFFTVRQLSSSDRWPWQAPKEVAAVLSDNRYTLESGRRYLVEVYTYSPAGGAAVAGTTSLLIDSDEKEIRFTSNKGLALDSRYDLNRFILTTDQKLFALPAALRLALRIPTADPKVTEERCDIALELRFRGSWPLIAIRVLVIALGTAAPAILGAFSAGKFSYSLAAWMIGFACIAGLATLIPSLKKN